MATSGSDSLRTQRFAIPKKEQLDSLGVAAFEEIRASRGSVAGPFALLMSRPELASCVAAVGQILRFHGELPGDLREVAILATANARECSYEWQYHVPLARAEGVGTSFIAELRQGREIKAPTPEALIFAYVTELCRANRVTDATHDALAAAIGPAAVLELSALVGYYTMLACVLNAAQIEGHVEIRDQ